ncbi:MAG TPA: nucleotide exchange factor GrpE [Anaeromyxobacter sp.]|nr:nucleotide exchange factor GrpE [Anaeromyxobacter sp.]
MADSPIKGAFQADIPADAVEEALRSVERIEGTPAAPAIAEGERPEEPAGAGPETDREKALAAQLELSQEKGRETLERLKDVHDRYLRAVAELENYKKRAQKERDEVLRYGNEKLLKDLFPVVDGLDRALAVATADDALAKGVKLVRSSLEQVLARYGITSFSALGEPFDPARHEALLQVPAAEPPGTVVMEHARGFLMHDRLARPAMVGVAMAPLATPPAGGGGDPGDEPGAEGGEG